MEYNSTRKKLVIPEYGRNIQKLINYAVDMEDRKKRTQMAYLIVHIMASMNPQVRDSADYKRKLWDHMFIISGFKLDVDAPYPKPSPDVLTEKPKRLEYGNQEIRFRHYGKNVEKIIEKAKEYEEGEEKDALVQIIANHLKKSYLNWNRDSVNDQLIEDHLKLLSGGALELNEKQELAPTAEILSKARRKKFNPRQQNDNQRGGGGSNHRDNRRRRSNYSNRG